MGRGGREFQRRRDKELSIKGGVIGGRKLIIERERRDREREREMQRMREGR